ncbi:NAD+ synthase [Temperatibacter marinus]|uniref:Glutamine-dependent NAD(+) synthetase n=1 Tax=Temperatibacter marinus TaxID=1456591 RepID=A0AA52EGU4_9PROT|nr:NAD+ synthase [Temperatibacter marinus]WND02084.1 NAD+ synthase [Temperatibacter marinus]
MTINLKIYIAQLNPTVGAVASNCDLISSAYEQASQAGADLIVTPELSVVGYPIEDLVLKPSLVTAARDALDRLSALTKAENAPGLLVGVPYLDRGKLHNATVLLDQGKIQQVRYKYDLPNYGVFDEVRVFEQGPLPAPIEFRGCRLGVMICEDMWFEASAKSLYQQNADILIVPTCSPFEADKHPERMVHATARVAETKLPLVFCNQIGGQDELVFEGASFVLNKDGTCPVQMKAWQEEGALVEFQQGACITRLHEAVPSELEAIYQAMVLGVKDYVNKNRFPGVLIGLSGGVDSALTAAVAVDALGADRVRCVMMPSRYTSGESLTDAEQCAEALKVSYENIAIAEGVAAFDKMLEDAFSNTTPDTTEENIQSRLRGLILMSLSNKFGYMVLTTGNKSEMSVGYATLYGDMCGGYNPLKDVYKTTAFDLCHWRNTHFPTGALGPDSEVIPVNIIVKPPTAELRDDQKDEDSLPPYERLDAILRALVDEEKSVKDLLDQGFDKEELARIEHLLYIAEYKRRQAPPGVKITRKNYGRDRRYPITNGYRSAHLLKENKVG